MRVDKYLKVTRILKRRTVSKELALHNRILINDKIAKPSSEVHLNDKITIIYGNRLMSVLVKDIKENVRKDDASIMYEIIEEGFVEDINTES